MTIPLIILLCGLSLAAATAEHNHRSDRTVTQTGTASWYGYECSKTASGEHYNPKTLTAAHRTLPFGTMVQVRNTANGKTATVRINNRGPFKKGRIIDVSKAAAEQLDMIHSGTAKVELVVVH
ncbi:MAG TPA: septal ring lytic transglycosylase RlpA family protein [Chthoniobacter sp.]|jgi:rare lipoprotein A